MQTPENVFSRFFQATGLLSLTELDFLPLTPEQSRALTRFLKQDCLIGVAERGPDLSTLERARIFRVQEESNTDFGQLIPDTNAVSLYEFNFSGDVQHGDCIRWAFEVDDRVYELSCLWRSPPGGWLSTKREMDYSV